MSLCAYCKQRKGKRPCPALGGMIESACCGKHARVDIQCPPDCRYLAGLAATQARHVLAAEMRAVTPPELGYEILSATRLHSVFAALLERRVVDIYRERTLGNHFDFGDAEARRAYVYLLEQYLTLESKPAAAPAAADSAVAELYGFDKVSAEFESQGLPREEQRKILLRLLVSVDNMSGGPGGSRAYVEYLNRTFLVEDYEEDDRPLLD